MSHTPGPWSVYMDGDFVHVYSGDLQEKFASVQADWVADITTDEHTEAEIDANARLIAAAPELLETLKRIDLACTYPENEFMRTMRDVARAAIAKAQGNADG